MNANANVNGNINPNNIAGNNVAPNQHYQQQQQQQFDNRFELPNMQRDRSDTTILQQKEDLMKIEYVSRCENILS